MCPTGDEVKEVRTFVGDMNKSTKVFSDQIDTNGLCIGSTGEDVALCASVYVDSLALNEQLDAPAILEMVCGMAVCAFDCSRSGCEIGMLVIRSMVGTWSGPR